VSHTHFSPTDFHLSRSYTVFFVFIGFPNDSVCEALNGRVNAIEKLGTCKEALLAYFKALGYGLDDRGVRIPAGAGNFSPPRSEWL
jgi:hypothetical protein